MKPARLVGIQYAALPYRTAEGQTSILLISSRRTRRWVIPKGWPMEGRRPCDAAAAEAVEEAGLYGAIATEPLGSYQYVKEIKNGEALSVQVLVFSLDVQGQLTSFKEEGQRTADWFPYRHAARAVAEPGLRRLIFDFGNARSTNLLARGFRRYRSWRFGP